MTVPSTVPSIVDPAPDEVQFDCPRCGGATTARFFGPCPGCTDELRASQGSAERDVTAPEYEPKMNVTPNAVATRD